MPDPVRTDAGLVIEARIVPKAKRISKKMPKCTETRVEDIREYIFEETRLNSGLQARHGVSSRPGKDGASFGFDTRISLYSSNPAATQPVRAMDAQTPIMKSKGFKLL